MRQAPRGTALDRAQYPEAADWGLAEHLLAAAVDALRGANWQRANGKERDRPKPVPRPGIEPEGKQIGKQAIPMQDMAKALGWDQETEAARV